MRKRFHFPRKQCKLFFFKRDKGGVLRENINCIRMAWPLARFKPGGKCIWGIMVRRLNANVKKCNTVAQLLSSIMEVCKAIKNEICHNLINSMTNRIYK